MFIKAVVQILYMPFQGRLQNIMERMSTRVGIAQCIVNQSKNRMKIMRASRCVCAVIILRYTILGDDPKRKKYQSESQTYACKTRYTHQKF